MIDRPMINVLACISLGVMLGANVICIHDVPLFFFFSFYFFHLLLV